MLYGVYCRPPHDTLLPENQPKACAALLLNIASGHTKRHTRRLALSEAPDAPTLLTHNRHCNTMSLRPCHPQLQGPHAPPSALPTTYRTGTRFPPKWLGYRCRAHVRCATVCAALLLDTATGHTERKTTAVLLNLSHLSFKPFPHPNSATVTRRS